MIESTVTWNIIKKLLDAGGLGPRVYIHFPRWNGKTMLQYEYYKQLMNQGRQAVIMRPNRRPIGLQNTAFSGVVIDRDVLEPMAYIRAERIWNEYWKSRQTTELKGE